LATSLLLVASCSQDTINLPDLGPRVTLLEAKDVIQDARLDALELRASDLEGRMGDAEDAIDENEDAIADLFDSVDGLEDDLRNLRGRLRSEINARKRADRMIRREHRSSIRNLRAELSREIRARRHADAGLQDQIDDLEGDVRSLSRRLSRDEFLVFLAFNYLNNQLNDLENSVDQALLDLSNRIDVNSGDITTINNNLRRVRNAILALQAQDVTLADAINNIALTPGPQGEQGIPGVDGIDGQDGEDGEDGADGSGGNCNLELRDVSTYHGNVYRADVYAVCSEGSIRLVNNASVGGN